MKDAYITSSIKESTRDKRGKGKQREVAGKINYPVTELIFYTCNSEIKSITFRFYLYSKLASMKA